MAGFDVLYALFDLEHDRAHGLHSLPARFGVTATFWVARACHVLTVALPRARGRPARRRRPLLAGRGRGRGLLLYEHLLVSPKDTSRLDLAFFTMNGVISVTFFAFVLADVIV